MAMTSPRLTFLFITDHKIARSDIRGRGSRRYVQSTLIERDGRSLSEAVDTALQLDTASPGPTWIVTSDAWSGKIQLPADSTARLPADALIQALRKEAELESGFDVRSSVFGFIEQSNIPTDALTSVRTWDAIQLDRDDFVAVAGRIEAAGASFLGVLPHSEAAARGDDEFADENESTEAGYNELADRWESRLNSDEALLCIAHKTARRMSAQFTKHVSLATLVVSFAICGWIEFTMRRHIDAVRVESAEWARRSGNHADQEEQLQLEQRRVAEMRKQVELLVQHNAECEGRSRAERRRRLQSNIRWTSLLNALPRSIDGECWLQRMVPEEDQSKLYGITLNHAAAHRFAAKLERELTGRGWRVTPAVTCEMENGLTTFEILLQPVDADVSESLAQQPHVSNSHSEQIAARSVTVGGAE
ncbi:MAG: hypothetical protein U0892_21025 [Pirellulales bacterium]